MTERAWSWKTTVVLAVWAALALGIYLWGAARTAGLGFPLDDAWIHQTYARNLVDWGQWSYWKDVPSAGSTAPLWSLILASGYALRVNLFAWAYFCGWMSLFAVGVAGEALARALLPDFDWKTFPWVGILLIGEWHLVWAAGSGMETVLTAALALAVLWGVARGGRWGWVGLLIGMGVWLRPDTLTLLGPALLTWALGQKRENRRWVDLIWMAGGFLLLFAPYLLFNVLISGAPLPNTFYAKQAEYAVLLDQPLMARYLDELRLPLVGAGLLLLPGMIWFGGQAIRAKHWAQISLMAWALGFALVYALRLPVTYQYGRYLMPAMPVFWMCGVVGSVNIWQRTARIPARTEKQRFERPPRIPPRLAWVLGRVWLLSAVGVWLGFYGLAESFYARDVAIINTEMVATAHWVAANTPPGSLIAAHDIGAMGYYGQRRLLDLAGLVSPEVIPLMRDEDALARWMDTQKVDYLVTLPDWYDHLTAGKTSIYQTGAPYSPSVGGTNMNVYLWKK